MLCLHVLCRCDFTNTDGDKFKCLNNTGAGRLGSLGEHRTLCNS